MQNQGQPGDVIDVNFIQRDFSTKMGKVALLPQFTLQFGAGTDREEPLIENLSSFEES